MNYAKIRQAEIERHAANIGHDDGAKGRIFELECASHASRKIRVAKQGQADVFVKIGNGKYKAECKTNGGRIEGLYAKNAPRYVIYRLEFTQKHKSSKSREAWEELRYIPAVLIPTNLFLAKLEQFGAIKSTNGKNPELAIQVSSKRWYEWLMDYPVIYDPEFVYAEWDFEGLD